MLTPDTKIIQGLKGSDGERRRHEEILYRQYAYFIDEGCRKYHLIYDDSFSAYQDAYIAARDNIILSRFDGHSSLKTYFFQIFCNKCIDLVRKNTTNKQQVHKTVPVPDLLVQLPDNVRTVIERLINDELKEKVNAKLQTMGEKCNAIIRLFREGLTDKEIAERLHYGNAAVAKTTRLRCLEKLRRNMLG